MHSDREAILTEIFFIFIAPIALLVTGVVPVTWRMLVLCGAILLMYGIIQHEKISDSALGITNGSFQRSLIPYLLFTLLGVFFLVQLANNLQMQPMAVWWQSPHLLFLFLPVSLLQEIAYRGFLFYKLKQLTPSWFYLIAINTLLFAFLHVIYPVPLIMLPVAVASGVFFAVMYRYFPNLILISLSHAVLNFTAVLYGFFYFHE